MASSKVTALTAQTATPAVADLLYLVDDPSGTPVSKKITVGNLLYKTQTLTDGATINWDLSLGGFATVTLGDDRTLAAPTNMIAGARYTLIIIQDGTGSRLLTWNAAYKFPGGTDPTLSTAIGAVDIVEFVSDGASLFGVFAGAFA